MPNVFWGDNGPVEQSDDGAFYVHDKTEEDKEFDRIVGGEDEESSE